jgi:enoyl-CoA hydratase
LTGSEVVKSAVDGAVMTITIDRPDRRNAINPEVTAGIAEALATAESDESVRAIVITGSGDKAFCAGGDLGGMVAEGKVGQHYERAGVGQLFVTMRKSRVPIVARVNGHALAGGFGLMLACDLVVATEDAELGTPEINLGLWPFMISAIIQRDVPRKVALELMLTGRRMPASEAQRWGFVNQVVPRDELDKAVGDLVDELTSKSPLIAALGKRSFYRAEDMDFDASIDYLSAMFTVALESEDTVEGVTAWMEKRAPNWKGR